MKNNNNEQLKEDDVRNEFNETEHVQFVELNNLLKEKFEKDCLKNHKIDKLTTYSEMIEGYQTTEKVKILTALCAGRSIGKWISYPIIRLLDILQNNEEE